MIARNSRHLPLAALVAATVAIASPLRALSIQFGDQTVAASGLPAGGSAVLLGVSRIYGDQSTRVVETREVALDDDGDGIAEIEAPVVPGAVWVAVDLATGASVRAVPPAGELRDGNEFAPEIELEVETGNGKVRLAGRAFDFLVVRPGVGAWFAISYDGADEEGPGDGFVRIDHSELKPLGDFGDAPRSVTSKDLVVGIDPQTLRVLIRRGSQLPVEVIQ